jgi:flagellar biosynthesis chaperone FliJ
VRTAEREVTSALQKEQVARLGYTAAHRDAEVARRVQEKKRAEIRDDREKREQKAFDELATLRFNVRAAIP